MMITYNDCFTYNACHVIELFEASKSSTVLDSYFIAFWCMSHVTCKWVKKRPNPNITDYNSRMEIFKLKWFWKCPHRAACHRISFPVTLKQCVGLSL